MLCKFEIFRVQIAQPIRHLLVASKRLVKIAVELKAAKQVTLAIKANEDRVWENVSVETLLLKCVEHKNCLK